MPMMARSRLNLPFNFRFIAAAPSPRFSSAPTAWWPSAPPAPAPRPTACPTSTSPPTAIIAAAYWMDLDPSLGGHGAALRAVLGNMAPNQSMVMQFTNVPPPLGGGTVTFPIILNQDNSFDFTYVSTSAESGGASAEAGLRSAYDCPNHQSFGLSCQPSETDLSDSTGRAHQLPRCRAHLRHLHHHHHAQHPRPPSALRRRTPPATPAPTRPPSP